jgi:Fic family protein
MGTRLIKEKGFLNTNGIIAIQKELEENNAGLRRLPGTALINDLTDEVIYTPPDNFDTISDLMNNLEEYLNNDADDISPLIKLAIQHYQFESIHPFYDGNGRTGRIINALYVILKGLLNEPVLYLSSYIIQNKGDYYRLLQEVRTKNNWEDWILYMLKGIEQTALSTIEQINKINHLFSETQKLVQEKLPRVYSKDLIEQLYIHPYSKIEFLVNNLGIERKAASRYLSSLEELGVLKSQQKGKEVIYINTKLYNLLKKG